MATTAKKPASKPVSNTARKPAAQAAPAKPAATAKKPAAASKPVASKAASGKPKVAAKPPENLKTAAKAKPAAVKATPSKAPVAPEKPARSVQKSPDQPMKSSPPTASSKTASKPAKPAKPATNGIPQTDAELLAMPDSAYMNEVQLRYFKNKLIAMRDEMLENARETGEHLKENEVFAYPNDRATVEEENLLEQRVRDRERKLLKKINASLARIEEGEYGYCLETGEPIGLPRLLARPTAELSIEAQEKHERMERLYAD